MARPLPVSEQVKVPRMTTEPVPHPARKYCVTRTLEVVDRGYISAENETHARVLAERHWDREKLPGPFVPVSESTDWQVKEVGA